MNYVVIQVCPDEKCAGNRYFKNAIKANSLQEAEQIKSSLENKPEHLSYCNYCQNQLIPTVAESG